MAKNDPDAAWANYITEVGLRLNQFRTAAGLSQEKVANQVGITRNHYQLLEKGKSSPTAVANPQLRTIAALAEVLGVGIGDIMPDKPRGITTGA
ncbi:helix-turn-helix domain-containing protein [Psychromicrobium sp. YIM B11713]|uniref:helix-turn-helix domain-containing protein n=1 Tax=Psychromicrobium sp. YIM B11713 TaxID=3145233 RepID=UPI00374E8EC1